MKQILIFNFRIHAIVIVLYFLGCSEPAKVEKEIKINIDSIYSNALKVAFKGKCFYNPISPEKIRDVSISEDVFSEAYVYFSKRFENFIVDSTIEFEHEELNVLVKKPEFLAIDNFNLSSYDNIALEKASEAIEEFSINDLAVIGFQRIQKNKLFCGYIIFSKPIIKRHVDKSYELFIRVIKMIDSPRNCYVRLLVKDNIIVASNEVAFRTSLIFR